MNIPAFVKACEAAGATLRQSNGKVIVVVYSDDTSRWSEAEVIRDLVGRHDDARVAEILGGEVGAALAGARDGAA
jgi:hypothetical protein